MPWFPNSLDWLTLIADLASIIALVMTIVIAIIGDNLRKLLRFREYYGDLVEKTEQLAVLSKAQKFDHNEVRIKISEIRGIVTSIPKQDRGSIGDVYSRLITELDGYSSTRTDDSAKSVLDAAYVFIQHIRQIGKGI